MQPEDVYALTGVADPRISPDGDRVAYVVWSIDRESNEYRGAIWVVPLDGSAEPRRFTSGERRDGMPRWSPDGRWLAFTSNRGGEKQTAQLYVIPAEGGEARKLTDLKEAVEDAAWSPDSTRIAFTARTRDEAYEEEDERKRKPRRVTRLFYKLDSVGWTTDRRRHIYVVGLEGEEPRQLTHGDSEEETPTWSPDGSRIVFSSLRGEDWDRELINRLYSLDVDGGGDPVQLTDDAASRVRPAFSPDGTQVAYHYVLEDGTYPHHAQVAVMNEDGSNERLLTTSLDRQCAAYPDTREPIWDGGRIVFLLEDGGNTHLYAAAADGASAPELLVGGERALAGYDLRGGALAFVASTSAALRELYAGADERKLTDVGRSFAEERELVSAERFTAISKDGTEVDAWLMLPAGYEAGKRYPVLLNIHGGPFTQYTTGFFDEFQVYAGAGYAVLYSNPRGGSGYTEAWGRAIRGPIDGGPGWGTVDFEDVIGVVDAALATYDFLDPERLGVMGGSYGGYLTSWTISHDNRFKAAVSERAVNDFYSAVGSSDLWWVFERQFGGRWYEHIDAWLDRSPTTYATSIETPVLIIHSEQDLRCGIEQGERLFIELRLLGREVEMLRFPGESHELTRGGSPLHRVQRFEAILEWYSRYLG